MKKYFLTFLVLSFCLLLPGCMKKEEKNIAKQLSKKIEKASSYHLKGTLEIINNEDSYLYDVDVAYQKQDKFRVSLKNKTNDHEQIILKNEEGVYVLTPSLNKSFKFQSNWPYNNSQSYLLQTLIKDIENDSNKEFKETENGYVFTTKVNYSNNKDLVKQKIYVDKDLNITEVHVLNDKDQVLMKMKFTEIDLKPNYSDNYFTLKENMNVSSIDNKEIPVSSMDTITYPMYIPQNTYLKNQETINKENGKRVILTFDGDNPFMLVQETVDISDEFITIPMYGEPEILSDCVASISEDSITWVSGGIEYYVVSDVLTQNELVNVAKSISVMPVGK